MLSPLTGNNNVRKIRELSPGKIADRWRTELSIEVGDRFEMLPVIEHWHCNATGFEWYEPAECAGGGRLYEQLQRFDWYYMKDKWEFQEALDIFPVKSKILEVGVGPGYFLSAAQLRGSQIFGIELNPAAAKAARTAGFTVYEEKLEDLEEMLGPVFDGLCAFQVLEHIPNPIPFIKGALGLLRSGGQLVLTVPNSAVTRVIDPEGIGLLDLPPHHVTRWDEAVFRSLENLLPVRVTTVKREPLQTYHIDWFVSSISDQLRRNLGSLLGRLLVNRFSIKYSKQILQLGFRSFVPGHTLLVVMEKI